MPPSSKRQLTTAAAPRTEDDNLATIAHLPSARHAVLTGMAGSRIFGADSKPSIKASVGVMIEETNAVLKGDLSTLTKTLVGQAATLDTAFTELLRRSYANMAEYNDAAERYRPMPSYPPMLAAAQASSKVANLARSGSDPCVPWRTLPST